MDEFLKELSEADYWKKNPLNVIFRDIFFAGIAIRITEGNFGKLKKKYFLGETQ